MEYRHVGINTNEKYPKESYVASSRNWLSSI